jgi:ATP-dependent Clp protease ATP-binding subunit ClpA
VLDEAAQAARGLGHDFVGTEHVLLGLFQVPDSDAARALTALGLSATAVRTEVVKRVAALMS